MAGSLGWRKDQAASIVYEHGNILEAEWGEGDLIFIASLLFGSPFMQQIHEKSLKCKKGSWLITLGARLPNSEFIFPDLPFNPDMHWQVMFMGRLAMSWGWSTINIDKKIRDPVASKEAKIE